MLTDSSYFPLFEVKWQGSWKMKVAMLQALGGTG